MTSIVELAAKYGPRWEIYEGYVYWLAVKSCEQKCLDPEHLSRHILFGHTLEDLAAKLEIASLSP